MIFTLTFEHEGKVLSINTDMHDDSIIGAFEDGGEVGGAHYLADKAFWEAIMYTQIDAISEDGKYKVEGLQNYL